jgi:molecular chaperone GrpE
MTISAKRKMSDDKKPIDEPVQSPSEATAPPESGEVSVEQLKAMIGALQGDLEKKSAELSAKQDQYLRAVAETENVRRRLEKEKEDTAKYAISKFAKDILSIGDNFQRAIAAVPKDAVETDPALKTLLDGVVLAERDYKTALERHGVQAIDPAGQPFNPHHHQAVMEQENTSVPAGTVLQVYQVGYLLDDRCLRPAMVVVSRGGPKAGKAEGRASESSEEPPSTMA